MSAKRIVRYTLKTLPADQTDWKRVEALTDEEIERAIDEDSDAAPRLDEAWFRSAERVTPSRRVPISLRVEPEVLDWYRAQGPRYQSRMQRVLKAYMKAKRRTG